MVKYEMVFILDARLTDGEKAEISRQITDNVAKHGGKMLDCAVWLDKHRFSFPMNKVWDGTYYMAHFEMKGPDVAKIRRDLHINERVLRFQIFRPEASVKV